MPWLLLAMLLAAPPGAKQPAGRAPYCTGTYADDFAALGKPSVELANKPEAQFTYCMRITATYECLSYASDGTVRRSRKDATAHGTAFAYKRQGSETLLLTNNHMAEYPTVTDEEHPVSGVPAGCKRVSDSLRLVDNEKDAFEGDDVPLTRVVTDPALDMAVVKSKAALTIMPWKVGRSSALRDRNVVEVRGFPLGAFKATTQGKVTSSYDHDDYQDWDHDDFVVDAQLSSGNSGSPVLAVNCATGEFELVGVFHADYARGKSLNIVVHIDQVRELMTTLKRTTPAREDHALLTHTARKRLVDDSEDLGTLYFPFGSLTVAAHPRGSDGALLFSIFPRDFPSSTWPAAVLEDLDPPDQGGFGTLGRVWFGNARGLAERTADSLDENDRAVVERALDNVRQAAQLWAAHRTAALRADASRENADNLARLDKEIKRAAPRSKELAGSLLELAEKLAPQGSSAALPPARPFLHVPAAEAGNPSIPSMP